MAFHASDDDTCNVASFCGLLESLRSVSLPVTAITCAVRSTCTSS